MIYKLKFIVIALSAVAIFNGTGQLQASEVSVQETKFATKIYPILKSKCFACHGENTEKIKGELVLNSIENILKGGESGEPALIPGNAIESLIYSAVTWADEDFQMPPKENDRLSPEQIDLLRVWIDEGAPWVDEAKRKEIILASWSVEPNEDGILVQTSGGLSDEWTYRRYKPVDVWAFQPVRKPEGSNSSIDDFVNEKLAAAGIEPAPLADAYTLIRRATYDLTGLPPTPQEIETFTTAYEMDAADAWSSLIDRLLASPRYGERWGQHWLDIVRYADTSGFSNDFERSNAWRYRDYVIRSFNDDKPYDQFIMEQIAGDEMDPKDPEMLIAAGMLRMGPWEHTAMAVAVKTRQQYLDDVVNSVGQTFMSTTMRCFKCHDHKFDPLPTKDYYRMYATFSATQPAEREAAFLDTENRDSFGAEKEYVDTMYGISKTVMNALNKKREDAAREWFEERGKEYLNHGKRNKLPDSEKPNRFVGLDPNEQAQTRVYDGHRKIWLRAMERYEPLSQSVYNGYTTELNSRELREPNSNNKKNLPTDKKLDDNFILTGGSVFSKGMTVTPGVLSALGIPSETALPDDPYALPEGKDNRRLTLAKWLSNPQNQLTTRSIVNRVWGWHFSTGIAANPNNFGATGNKPTHPELLDWLALSFVEDDWSIKTLHRKIMMSDTYRRANEHPTPELLDTKDPNNHLLAKFMPRRLSAEEMRDSMLMVSGSLNMDMGGIPTRPEINMEVTLAPRLLQSGHAPTYLPSPTPERRNRRSIYSVRIRGLADPFMEVFNMPNSTDSCERRDTPSVTPQVFTLMNSDEATSRSIEMALRVSSMETSDQQRIVTAYHLAYGKKPSAVETELLMTHLQNMTAYHLQNDRPEPIIFPSHVARSGISEFTGVTYEFEERLPTYENYHYDPQPSEQSPETLALADVCLLLFNSNQFAYVY